MEIKIISFYWKQKSNNGILFRKKKVKKKMDIQYNKKKLLVTKLQIYKFMSYLN